MDRGYDPMAAPESLDDVEEARAVTAVRAARMAALTPEERIERVHALCQALARLAAAPRDCPGAPADRRWIAPTSSTSIPEKRTAPGVPSEGEEAATAR